jgi:hypothetical protein
MGRLGTLGGLAIVALAMLVAGMAPLHGPAGATACPLPFGATGANGTCLDCHDEWGSAPRDGGLSIEGVPEHFEAGHDYTLVIVLERGTGPWPFTALAYAFELRASGGELAPVDVRTTASRGLLEVASTAVSNVTRWEVVWTAPGGYEDARFYAGAVVGDGDGTDAGDIPYMAWERSWAPLDVPDEEGPGLVPGTAAVLLAAVGAIIVVGYLLSFPRKPPPRVEIEEDGDEGSWEGP